MVGTEAWCVNTCGDKELSECKAEVLTLTNEAKALGTRLEGFTNDLYACKQKLNTCDEKQQKCEATLENFRKPLLCNTSSITPYPCIITMKATASELDLYVHTSGDYVASWKLFIQQNPGIIVGIVGKFNDGKTFVSNGLSCSVTSYPEGVDISTPGISIAQVDCGGTKFVLIDTAGLREVMKSESGDGPILDELYTDLMLRMVDAYVLVVEDFAAPDQHLVDHIKHEIETHPREMKASSIVVHNYKTCSDEGQMRSSITRSLNITKAPDALYVNDPRGVPHFFLGGNEFSAHNRKVFDALRTRLDMVVPRPLSIRDRLQNAVTSLLPRYIVSRDQSASRTPILNWVNNKTCDPLEWADNSTLNNILQSPYNCSNVLQASWPGGVLSLHKGSLQTTFLGVQKIDLRPRHVARFIEQETNLTGLVMELPGCNITVNWSSVVCERNEVEHAVEGSLPSGWEQLNGDNVEQMKSMNADGFIRCNRFEYKDGILKLFYYRMGDESERLLCDSTSYFLEICTTLALITMYILVTMVKWLLLQYEAWQLEKNWMNCRTEICNNIHPEITRPGQPDLDIIKETARKYSCRANKYLARARERTEADSVHIVGLHAPVSDDILQPLIAGATLEQRIDNMRMVATQKQEAFEWLLHDWTALEGQVNLHLHLTVAPIKSRERMVDKANAIADEKKMDEGDRPMSALYLTDINRAQIVYQNSHGMLRSLSNLGHVLASRNCVLLKGKNLFGWHESSEVPPCFMLKLGIPYDPANHPGVFWVVEVQLTFPLIARVAPFCHTLYEVQRATVLPRRCPGCGNLHGELQGNREAVQNEGKNQGHAAERDRGVAQRQAP